MSVRRIFQLPLICLLIVSLLASSASAASFVWCVSADGDHSALEFAPGGDCSRDDCTRPLGGTAPSVLSPEDDDCGACLDIASSHGWNVSRTRQSDVAADLPADLAPVALTARTPLPQRILNSHRLVELPPRIPDPILHHLTIVLLV